MCPTVPPSEPSNAISAGWRRVKSMLRPHRVEGHITYAAEPSASPLGRLVLGVIDDPELSMRLLSVRGGLTAASISALAQALAEVPDHAMLHLDLSDVEFANTSVISKLGLMLDVLEDRGVRVRIVGLGHLASVRLD
jgi:MFS superfamily sulfate permease-like transporter